MTAIDLFKSAALLAREKDFQAEAHALSRLGHTYKVTRGHTGHREKGGGENRRT